MAETRQTRQTWWSLTINNPTPEDDILLLNTPRFVKRVKYQKEVGENETPHYQIALQTQQVRFSQIKTWLPRAHIEPARNPQALLNYVEKTDTAVSGSQKDITGQAMTMAQVMRLIAKNYSIDGDDIETYPKTYESITYWRAVRKILAQNENLLGLLSQPQYFRAWEHTKYFWINKIQTESINADETTERHGTEEGLCEDGRQEE